MRDELTRLSYWLPKIEAAGLPVPRTEIIRVPDDDLIEVVDGKTPESFISLVANIWKASETIGVPFFLRTDFTSGKHEWGRTCFVADVADTASHVAALIEYSECVDILGLPTDVWVVREMIRTKPLFHAFGGRMPITREFRFFIRDGIVEHVQPYWPANAFVGNLMPDTPADWAERLAKASRLTFDERNELTVLTFGACTALGGGYWSVDWLQDADGKWWLTDMAEGEKSYRYGG